jgi:aspartyl-tRNA(Asn)/glutamyl-tRNA(Gln) amidotransferase subunit A
MAAMHDLDALQVAAQYASGGLSPVEVARAALERIAAWEPKLNAMYRVDREGALAAAKASEARWRSKQPLSALDGVPVTIKENIYTKGDPAPIGTKRTTTRRCNPRTRRPPLACARAAA